MKALLIVISSIWFCCQPTLFVVGNIDLEALGHCQKSGCRNSPDHAEEEADNYEHRGGTKGVVDNYDPRARTEKEYAANLRYQQQSQTELQPVIYPGELTFIVVFVVLIVLILALRIKGNVYTSIQIWYDKICRTARRSLISLRAHNSGGVVVASAGIRSRFISSRSAASLGSLVDLIGPGSDDDDSYNRRASETSYSSTDALDSSFHEVHFGHSLRRRSLGTSSCDSSYYSDESSLGMNASDEEYESDGASSDVERGDMRHWKSPDIARRRASMEAPTIKQQQAIESSDIARRRASMEAPTIKQQQAIDR
jgi:hypothetical protein